MILGDCLEIMPTLPDKSIDMTITSPPYDNLRTYGGSLEWGEHIWKPIIAELFRLTKDGGVVVWVVADATVKGSETGTSFKQALYFKEIGFNLHDTMIFEKDSFQKPNHNRYWACFEYMFVFSKGKPKTAYMISDRANSQSGKTVSSKTVRNADGSTSTRHPVVIAAFGKRKNIWAYSTGYGKGTTYKEAYLHPAMFPEQLATDHVISWSNPGDTILDPFAGSGTTGVACINTGRDFIGIELNQKYYEMARARIEKAQSTARQMELNEAAKPMRERSAANPPPARLYGPSLSVAQNQTICL
jgi:site-specific DNA-methyltransferase (adenine-specific)